MKRLLFTLFLLLSVVNARAQSRDEYLGIGLGTDIPLGAFAKNEGYYHTAAGVYNKQGFALAGVAFNVNYMHRINDWFGFIASYYNAGNTVSKDKVTAATATDYFTLNKPSDIGCILVGGYLRKRNIPFYIKALAGVGVVQTADMTLAIGDNTYDETFINFKQSAPAAGFAYDIGAGLIFAISRRLTGTLSADYVQCLAKPTDVTVTTNSIQKGNSTITTNPLGPIDYTQQSINLQVGLGYIFGKDNDTKYPRRFRR